MKRPKDLGASVASALEGLPDKISRLAPKANHILTSVGEEGFELVVSLLIMIVVERAYGQRGLGLYAFLTSCYYAVRYLANFGVARMIEIDTAKVIVEDRRNSRIRDGYQAVLFAALIGALIVLVSAGFDSSHTRIQERAGAYLVIALALPAANLNNFNLAVMQGLGRHASVARLRMLRHGLILIVMLLLVRAGVPPSYLLAAYLVADIITASRIRRHLNAPKFRQVLKRPGRAWDTLKQGRAHLFTDNALDLLLNIDFFILGLFVHAWDLGVYAEAAVLVRLFLTISLGIKPILRRRYAVLAARGKIDLLASAFKRYVTLLFSLQAALTLATLLFYPKVLDLFFELRGETLRSFQIFLVFVPGLIFYAAFSAQEPIYESLGRADRLKQLTLTTAAINLLLTFFLVPATGVFGAATSTMITMLAHFFLFGRRLDVGFGLQKSTFATAGLALYLVYHLLHSVAWGAAVEFWLGSLLMFLGFYGCGLYGVRLDADKKPITADD